MNKKRWILLLVILVFATILRFIQLGKTPQGFYRDEAALGYNAYSLIETGKDEFGKKWPILFRSFNDFKTPVYTYLLIPIYKIFGMTTWSTRALSAAMGVIGSWFCFLLIKNISKNINLALISTLLLAISPWHLIFSRTSYETNVAFTFFVVSLWSFYKFKQNNKYLISAAIMAALSFLTYHSERVIVPLVYLVLFIKENKYIFAKKNLKITIVALTLGFIIILPTLGLMTTPGFLSRLNSLSILSKNVKEPWGYNENLTGFKNKVLNNNLLLQIREFSSLYTSYFSPRYLFGLGDPEPRTSYPDLAPLLFWQLPFLIIGLIYFLNKTKNDNKEFKFLMIILILASPIPASITRDPFSSTRALPLVLPLNILIACGIYKFLNKFKNLGLIILISLILWSFGKIYLSVFKFNDYFRGLSWQNGVEKMIAKIKSENLPIMIDSKGDIYSQVLFFTRTSPREYQKDNFEVSEHDYYTNMNRNKVKKINNITIRTLDWGKDTQIEQILVGDALAISDTQIKEHCLTKIFEIKDLNDKVLFVGLKTNPELKKRKGMCF